MSFTTGRAQRVWSALLTAGLMVLQGAAYAQEFRGSITGRVSDPSGAALPGVAVTATNTATNGTTTSVTNEAGDYHLLYLPAGIYSVSAELDGFKKRTESKVEVRIGDRLELSMKLELGAQSETVEVVSEAPLLDTSSASAGQVIDERRLALMPLSDGNPFVLARLAPGVAYVSNLNFARSFDNNATSGLRSDGGPGKNEFTLDGTPNNATGGEADHGRVAFVPPSDAVQEFKVETASFDAQQGHTSGANVNVAIKSGTNRFSGTAYTYYRDDKLAADEFFNKKLGEPKPPLSYKRFGATLGGPVSRDKTFFFLAFEGLLDEFPEPNFYNVPTERMRQGDFGELLAQGIQLYDPMTARRDSTGRVVRDPFPNNVIPANRIHPVARQVLSYYPAPNQAGDGPGVRNFYSTNPRTDDFYSLTGRVDHAFSSARKLFVRYSMNDRIEHRNEQFGEVNGVVPLGGGASRTNNHATADYVHTLSGTTLLNVRAGFSRFTDATARPHEGFDTSSLGFSPEAVAVFGGARYFPTFDFDSFQDIGNGLAATTISKIYSAQATLTRVTGAHSVRMGIDLRAYRDDVTNPGNQAGTYQFRNGFTSRQDGTPGQTGGDLAMFLLGIPTGGSIDRNAGRSNQVLYGGVFIQDDWRVSEKLTLNLGLRYDVETGMTESENRNTRGFDLTSPNPVEPAAQASYAANPLSQLPASQFSVRGGYLYASAESRNLWNADLNNIQPRLGFAYKLDAKTVVRGGLGIYYSPFAIDASSAGVNQIGFSQSTPIPTSTDTGLTFPATLTSPFTRGIQDPPGSAPGLVTAIGRGVNAATLDRNTARSVRFLASVQRELPGAILFEASYVGNRGSDIEVSYSINPIPREYLADSGLRNATVADFLGSTSGTNGVPNPFRNNPLIPSTENFYSQTRLSRGQILRPYPQFTDVTGYFYDGTSTYNAGQFRLEKRFTQDFSVSAGYTYSKFMEKASRLNPTDTEYEERPHYDDSRHRVTASMIWELPFAKSAAGVTKGLLGGWAVTGIFTLQTGTPIVISDRQLTDRYFFGDPSTLKADWNLDNWNGSNIPVFPTEAFYQHEGGTLPRNDQRLSRSNNVRTLPTRLDNFRTQTRPLLDASVVKTVTLSGRARLQLRAEVFNVLNYVELGTPNFDPASASFGTTANQNNLTRELQIGVKLVF